MENDDKKIIGEDTVALSPETKMLFPSYQEYRKLRHIYTAAVQQLEMRLNVLNEEFEVNTSRSPIHHIESRLKSTSSIIEKLKRRGFEVSVKSAIENLNDIGGVRVVCNYIDDVYRVEEMLLRQNDIELTHRQDYIERPNHNGYRSLHLDVAVPVFLSDHTEYIKVEIQLRSVAMDFWASLEHDMRYKSKQEKLPEDLEEKMWLAAKEIAGIDQKIQELYYQIQKLK